MVTASHLRENLKMVFLKKEKSLKKPKYAIGENPTKENIRTHPYLTF
jgi:hypothetical protein